MILTSSTPRSRPDLCPGVRRPWSASDGALVRLRLIGGRITAGQLRRVAAVAADHGDGDVHLTGRANLQVRGLPDPLGTAVVVALEDTGLVPSRSHELARNVLVSPLTGLVGGRADLRPVAAELDRLLCASRPLAALPGRFLVVLDDGRGDLRERPCDLGLVVLDDHRAQLRVGEEWGEVVELGSAPRCLVELAGRFMQERGVGSRAPWHVRELPRPLVRGRAPDPRLPSPVAPLPHGPVPGVPGLHHVGYADGLLRPAALAELLAGRADDDELAVTPWRGVLAWS